MVAVGRLSLADPDVTQAVYSACDSFIQFVVTGETQVRDWRRKRAPGEKSDDLTAGTVCTTWAVLRRHIARSFAERYEVSVASVEVACGPWTAEPDVPPLGSASSAGGDHVQALRLLLASQPKLPLQLGSWSEENVAGEPLESHVAFARLNRELRKQCSGPGLYAAITRDPT